MLLHLCNVSPSFQSAAFPILMRVLELSRCYPYASLCRFAGASRRLASSSRVHIIAVATIPSFFNLQHSPASEKRSSIAAAIAIFITTPISMHFYRLSLESHHRTHQFFISSSLAETFIVYV